MDQKRVAEMLDAPMVAWSSLCAEMTMAERMEVSDSAAAMATKAARLSAYLSRRVSGGKHEDAVTRQNQVAAKVRQALGYTYNADPVSF